MRQYTALVLSMLTCCATGAMAGSAIGFFWFATHPASLITKILVYVAASIFLFIVVDDLCERAFKKQFWLASIGCLAIISVGVIVAISAFATIAPEESPSWPRPQMRHPQLADDSGIKALGGGIKAILARTRRVAGFAVSTEGTTQNLC